MKTTLTKLLLIFSITSFSVFLTEDLRAQDYINDTLSSCTKKGNAGGIQAGNDLFKVEIDTTLYPEATCNDGTPAVMYVRPGQNQSTDRWHIHLQGGGSCKDNDACAKRWCSAGTNYGADKMSTTITPPGMTGQGIFSRAPQNNFADWTHVYSYYCSSDMWNGDSTAVVQHTIHPSEMDTVSFKINFNGSNIVEAIIKTLQNGGISVTNQQGNVFDVPDLDNANIVLFSGTSGGGNGVIHNVDRVGDMLLPDNPELDYRGVVDASFSRMGTDLDWKGSTMCSLMNYCDGESYFNYSHRLYDLGVKNARLDDSCTGFFAGADPSKSWHCSETARVLRDHISSRLFVRKDLVDSNSIGSQLAMDFGSAGDYGQLTEFSLRDFRAQPNFAANPPGIFGPQCGSHVGLKSRTAFFEEKIVGPNGTERSFHDVLWSWVRNGPDYLVQDFIYNGRPPSCK